MPQNAGRGVVPGEKGGKDGPGVTSGDFLELRIGCHCPVVLLRTRLCLLPIPPFPLLHLRTSLPGLAVLVVPTPVSIWGD